MKQPNTILAYLLCAAVIIAASGQIFHACGQNAAPAATSTEQAAAKLKQKWTKALEDARHDFLNSNDRESAEFVGNILAALEQPDGMAPAALAAHAGHIKEAGARPGAARRAGKRRLLELGDVAGVESARSRI